MCLWIKEQQKQPFGLVPHDKIIYTLRALFHSFPRTNMHAKNVLWFSCEHSKLRPWKHHLTSVQYSNSTTDRQSVWKHSLLKFDFPAASVTRLTSERQKRPKYQCMIDVPQTFSSRASTAVCNMTIRSWTMRLSFVILRLESMRLHLLILRKFYYSPPFMMVTGRHVTWQVT